MNKLRLSHRLALGFGAVLTLLAIITATSYWGLSRINEGLRFIAEVYTNKAHQSQQMDRAVNHALIAMRNLSLEETRENELRQMDQLRQALQRYDAVKAQLSPLLTSAEEKVLFAKLEGSEKAARQIFLDARQQAGGDDAEKNAFLLRFDLRRNMEKWDGLQRTWSQDIENLARLEAELGQQYSAELQSTSTRIRAILLAVAGAALLAGIGASLLIARSITRPLASSVTLADRIAQGDLSLSQHTTRRDEIGQLLMALESMRGQLHELVSEVKATTDGIGSASSEIARGSMDLSHRTEEAASSLAQTAHFMAELTGQVSEAADVARQASQVAVSASDVAGRGGHVVTEVVTTMEDIAADSERIADIVGMIDAIAFQTNILALNAAVEAARAGEQGRGFAVVAGEVRNLAQRSAEAAKEIKGLIGMSTSKVTAGTRLVREAGSTMGDIVASVHRVSKMIGEISASTTAQNERITQVNNAVAQLDGMSQQNAALVEQCTATAALLADQASTLAHVVQRFKLTPHDAVLGALPRAQALADGNPRVPALAAASASASPRSLARPRALT
ncbi:methyl-accepting chemotaxis protein [Hylemonella gracilis]|uniref:Methyl-accepting chemotaxis sensory transducer n=1 Tax=Hylemonella gracilis ATCC 19624 TaxID=887062 RepID=F3KRT0_9BURK|nr:methyl-accepting chemotaxis protein [Hylemonella gracilis]EGI77531.1 methyl-accepting chemotaxis sensory transducer [Hylemonella gracilis ATCC 19624]